MKITISVIKWCTDGWERKSAENGRAATVCAGRSGNDLCGTRCSVPIKPITYFWSGNAEYGQNWPSRFDGSIRICHRRNSAFPFPVSNRPRTAKLNIPSDKSPADTLLPFERANLWNYTSDNSAQRFIDSHPTELTWFIMRWEKNASLLCRLASHKNRKTFESGNFTAVFLLGGEAIFTSKFKKEHFEYFFYYKSSSIKNCYLAYTWFRGRKFNK